MTRVGRPILQDDAVGALQKLGISAIPLGGVVEPLHQKTCRCEFCQRTKDGLIIVVYGEETSKKKHRTVGRSPTPEDMNTPQHSRKKRCTSGKD